MSEFRYTGLSNNGKSMTGTIQAGSEQAALTLLSGQGIIPIQLEAASLPGIGALEAKLAGEFASGRSRRVPLAVRTLFVRELATFIQAGVPLLEALAVLRTQENHPAFGVILCDVHDRVRNGDSFSLALTAHPRVFPPLLISMVRVGETGGMLGKVLDQMADWMEHQEEVRREVQIALAYPTVVMLLGIVTVFVLVSFVLPRITTIFIGMHAALPLPTRILLGVSSFMGQWWWAVALGAASLIVAAKLVFSTPNGKAFFDRLSLAIPVFGRLILKSSVALFARSSASLLSAGVPLIEALRVVRGLVANTRIVAVIDEAIDKVTRGQSLAQALGQSAYFPPSAIHLLGVGERTGRLSDMFERVAITFENQMRAQIKVMLSILSPLIIIVLAVMVGFIVIAILLPILRMNQMMT